MVEEFESDFNRLRESLSKKEIEAKSLLEELTSTKIHSNKKEMKLLRFKLQEKRWKQEIRKDD